MSKVIECTPVWPWWLERQARSRLGLTLGCLAFLLLTGWAMAHAGGSLWERFESMGDLPFFLFVIVGATLAVWLRGPSARPPDRITFSESEMYLLFGEEKWAIPWSEMKKVTIHYNASGPVSVCLKCYSRLPLMFDEFRELTDFVEALEEFGSDVRILRKRVFLDSRVPAHLAIAFALGTAFTIALVLAIYHDVYLDEPVHMTLLFAALLFLLHGAVGLISRLWPIPCN